MRHVSLAGRSLAALGLGDVSFVRASARGYDAAEVVRAVHDGIDASVELIDVADEPDAERAVGDAIRTLRARDRVVLATRVPALASTRDRVDERLPLGYVQERVEAALRATKLEALPLVQLSLRSGWREAAGAWAELRGTCARLVRDGDVLAWGALADDLELAGEDWLASIAVPFSICERSAAAGENKIAVLARRPLAGGALAGVLGPGMTFAPRDDRRAIDAARLEAIAIRAARLAPLVKRVPAAATSCEAARQALELAPRFAQRDTATLAELALRYVIDRGAIALPRIHRRDDLAAAIAAAAAPPLSPETIARIEEIEELDT